MPGNNKIVLDTNVIISAAISENGNAAKIFEMMIEERFESYTSNDIIEEIIDVFSRKKISKLIKPDDQARIVDIFKRFSVIVTRIKKLNVVKDDPKDNMFLECALSAKADYIISGDTHLLDMGEYNGIKVLSPAQFLKM